MAGGGGARERRGCVGIGNAIVIEDRMKSLLMKVTWDSFEVCVSSDQQSRGGGTE